MTANEPLRILQLSDPHLSRSHPFFQWNWEVALDEAARLRPDLIVISGDLCLDGANRPDDLAFAAEQCARLPAPWLAIPGNHDLGDGPEKPHSCEPLDDQRLAAWRGAFGRDWWDHDLGHGWRVIGLNAHLIASGLAAEAQQEAFLAQALAQSPGPILLFLHLPPFAFDEDDANTGASLAPEARAKLQAQLAGAPIAAIGCGHVHCAFETIWAGRRVVWAPATSMITRYGLWGTLPGRKAAGLVEWRLTGDGQALSRARHPDLFIDFDVSNWALHDGYAKALAKPYPA